MMIKSNLHFCWFFLLMSGFGLVFLSSCQENSNIIDQNNIVHVRITKDPIKLNPILKNSSFSRVIHQYIMPQICNYNPFDMEYESILLEENPVSRIIEDGPYKGMKAIKMKINPHARWDDGSKITAADYVFTIKTAKHPLVQNTSWKIMLEDVVDVIIDKENDQWFEVILNENHFLGLEMVSSLQLFPQYIYDANFSLDKISISELNDLGKVDALVSKDTNLVKFAKDFNSIKFYKNQVSSFGPYRLTEWETDHYIKLVKKDNYWAKDDSSIYLKQYPDEIIFHIIPDEINAITQFKNGNIDLLTDISNESYQLLEKDNTMREKFNFYSIKGMKYYTLVPNHRRLFLSDKNVRKALSYGIDVDNIIHTVEYNKANKLRNEFASSKKSYNNEIPYGTYDPIKARALLKKSGWEDRDLNGIVEKMYDGVFKELKLTYQATTSKKSQKIAALIKKQLLQAGIELEIEIKPFKLIKQKNLKTFDFDILMLARTPTAPLLDPYLKFHSDNIDPGEGNFSGFSNKRADELIEKIRVSTDKNQQLSQYHELQEIMFEEQVTIPLYELNQQLIINKKYKTKCFNKKPGYLVNTFKAN